MLNFWILTKNVYIKDMTFKQQDLVIIAF